MAQDVETFLEVTEPEVALSAEIIELLNELELPVSTAQAEQLHYELDKAFSEKKPAKVAHTVSELSSRIRAELSLRRLLVLTHDEAKLYEQTCELFGAEVNDAFPSCSFDIEEVGKCAALSRSTAAVMHCMRALEIPLQLIAKDLKITTTRDNWGNLLKEIDTAIIALLNSDARKSVYAEGAIQFRHIKVAWRDHAMHARGKYTENEARAVMNATKELMRNLARRIKE